MISGFKNTPLSNLYPAIQIVEGISFPTNEHFFQWSKTLNPTWKRNIASASTPQAAKSAGRKAPLRSDWDDVKDSVMLKGLFAKFRQNTHCRDYLLATGRDYLEETNSWKDRYWGVDGWGANRLGIYLMLVREELRSAQ